MKEMLYDYTNWLLSELEAQIYLRGFVLVLCYGVFCFVYFVSVFVCCFGLCLILVYLFVCFFHLAQQNSQTEYS